MISVNVSRRKAQIAGVVLLAGVAAAPNLTSPARAQPVALSAVQTASVNGAVQAGLAGIDPALSGAARDQAVMQVLGQVTAQEISAFGIQAITPVMSTALQGGISAPDVLGGVVLGGTPADETLVTQFAMNEANQLGIPNDVVAQGLGQGTALLSKTDAGAANQVAQVVRNEGTGGERQVFSQTVTANGGSRQLASIVQQTPSLVTGAILTATVATPVVTTVVAAQPQVATGNGVACTNPSCN